MTGIVDDQLRALIRITIAASENGVRQEIEAWVDTAFNGGLTIPRPLVDSLGLAKAATVEAILADGRTVPLDTFECHLDWFEKTYRTQIIASDGAYPLLGTMILADRRLVIDYAAKTVELT